MVPGNVFGLQGVCGFSAAETIQCKKRGTMRGLSQAAFERLRVEHPILLAGLTLAYGAKRDRFIRSIFTHGYRPELIQLEEKVEWNQHLERGTMRRRFTMDNL